MGNSIRCLIIDDEPLAIKLIRSHLEKLDCFEVAGECRNALKALEFLREEKIDLMFLDINMPEITGLDFLKTLHDPPYVIITTAYREYAVEGYDLDIVDFLLKPISFERFLKAINRFCNRKNPASNGVAADHAAAPERKYVYIQDGKNIFKLLYDDVSYFEGYGEYVKVITCNKTYVVRESLTDFEHKLPVESFLRIHKSYIVNLQKIKGFSTVHVMLKDNELPIGRIYRENAVKVLRKG
ncbi:MAG TPA: LytTR family DNA-binding domain-containing protein [Bacteroidales bacterium]|jgi:DNA-binding LytR/AlgR family response regulator|nr:LytTR family DNA-binding domain-containing protein [Bacteroidales bacterium]